MEKCLLYAPEKKPKTIAKQMMPAVLPQASKIQWKQDAMKMHGIWYCAD